MSLCVYVYDCMFMSMCVCACAYVYPRGMSICMSMSMCMGMCMYEFMCMCICACAYVYTCTGRPRTRPRPAGGQLHCGHGRDMVPGQRPLCGIHPPGGQRRPCCQTSLLQRWSGQPRPELRPNVGDLCQGWERDVTHTHTHTHTQVHDSDDFAVMEVQ